MWRSNGRYCMKIISNYIKHAPASITAEQFCKGVTEAVRKKYPSKKIEYYREHPEERLTASCIVYSRMQRQIWMIGDCQCLVGRAGCGNNADFELCDNPKPYEQTLAEARAAKANELISNGTATVESLLENDIARTTIIPQMIESMAQQNKTYSVVDGFKIPMQKVRILTFDFEPWTIIMASDGYPFLKPTLKESETALEQQRINDPLNIKTFKATKAFAKGNNSFDDRTYVKFNI